MIVVPVVVTVVVVPVSPVLAGGGDGGVELVGEEEVVEGVPLHGEGVGAAEEGAEDLEGVHRVEGEGAVEGVGPAAAEAAAAHRRGATGRVGPLGGGGGAVAPSTGAEAVLAVTVVGAPLVLNIKRDVWSHHDG